MNILQNLLTPCLVKPLQSFAHPVIGDGVFDPPQPPQGVFLRNGRLFDNSELFDLGELYT